MSICPKNKSSSKKRQEKSKLENERTESGEMQQMWRTYDATQSLQSLWILQQERNRYCRKLIKKGYSTGVRRIA